MAKHTEIRWIGVNICQKLPRVEGHIYGVHKPEQRQSNGLQAKLANNHCFYFCLY